MAEDEAGAGVKAAIASLGQGAGWVRRGWRMFRAGPLAWLVMVFVYWLIMTALSMPKYVGVVAATVLVPAFAVGFMAASRSAERGVAPALGLLFSGFRSGLLPQLVLGLAYFGSLALLLFGTTLADDGALAGWMLQGERPEEDVLRSDAFFAALLIAAGGYTPVMMLFWFAPVLAAWHGFGPAKALFFSFFACLLNWRAFLGYVAVVTLVAVAVPTLVLLAALVLSGGRPKASLVALLLPPLLLAILPTLLASFYASYRDVFGTPEAPGEAAEPRG